MKKIILILCAALMSCAHAKYIVPNDTITQTKTQTKTIERDSIFLHDSIYVREYTKGDTIFIDKIVEHFKDRWQTKIDTFARCDTITITQTQTIKEPVRYVPGFYRICTWICCIGVALLVLLLVLKFT